MTGKEKIEAAFSPEGTPELPAVICYERIFYRDHWEQITESPRWHFYSPDIKHQLYWRQQVIDTAGQDWLRLFPFYSRDDREHISIIEKNGLWYRTNTETGATEPITLPKQGGSQPGDPDYLVFHPLPSSREEVDKLIPLDDSYDKQDFIKHGCHDLSQQLLQKNPNLYPFTHINSPLWSLYSIWGFEGIMTLPALYPELAKHAIDRFLIQAKRELDEAVAMGAKAIWIEECMTDMLGPSLLKKFNLPPMKQLISAIRDAGLRSIYYFCGNPLNYFDLIFEIGADACSFEESKKDFQIDIAELAEKVQGKCVLLGNLDAIEVLQNGNEECLREEIKRQMAAGRKNNNRFIMSIGSPVTPETPVQRVRHYCNLVHEYGKSSKGTLSRKTI